MNSTANVQSIIAELAANMAATEAKIAALNPRDYVLIWNESPLRTDGASVSLCGPDIYTCITRHVAKREAARFMAALTPETRAAEPVTVMTAPEALAYIAAKNAALLATVRKANA